MSKITETVWELARPIAQAQDVEIWDVEYVRMDILVKMQLVS